MDILRCIPSFVPVTPPSFLSPPCINSLPLFSFPYNPKIRLCSSHSVTFPPTSPNPRYALPFPITATNVSDQDTVSEVEFEEIVEKDWSFLEFDDGEQHMQKIDRIISAGNIKETSKVLVSMGSESFVDRIVDSSPCEQLLVVHDSLLVLACIKEKYDEVKCWQGGLMDSDLPEKWTGFDSLYLYFLPALSFELDQVLAALAKRCLPGARLVISHPHGRGMVEEQRQQYPDLVLSNLPEKTTLHSAAANHSFQLLEFVDEPGFYLAVMRFNEE